MNIMELKVGDVVEIEPTQTTAWDRPGKTQNIGRLNKGEQYRVHKVHIESGLIELDMPGTGWPATLHPVASGGVWIDARFVKLPGAPRPEPVGLTRLERALLAAAKRFVEVMEA